MTEHEHFEELCALAVSDQIAPVDRDALMAHIETCAACRHAFEDFDDLARGIVPMIAAEAMSMSPPRGMTERFIARAHTEGIPLSRGTKGDNRPIRLIKAGALLIAAVVGLYFGLQIVKSKWIGNPTRRPPDHSQHQSETGDERASVLRENTTLNAQLIELRKELSQAEGEVDSRERALGAAQATNSELAARLSNLESIEADLRHDLATRDLQREQLNSELAHKQQHLDDLLSAKAGDEVQIQTYQSELNDLRAQVASLKEAANEHQQLSAAAEEAKDLIVARHLHIVDVHDNETVNKTRPFGRIFYAEGQKLVFYAYDLGDPRKSSSKISFCVWGEKSGSNEKVKNMGILKTDDRKDGRWVLTFSDPQVLSQINTVFVTAESSKQSVQQPSGNRILVAFLSGEANHP